LALAMIYNGAEGETQSQMKDVLELQQLNIQELNLAAGELMARLQSADNTIELAIANSIWAKQDFPFKQSFIDITSKSYDTEVRQLTEAQEINDWVSEKTRGKITKIVERINPRDIMFLINALYFKGSWESKFEEKATSEQNFTLLSGETIQHPLMNQFGNFPYYKDNVFQIIKLPYGNGEFSMMVLLPRIDFDFNKLLDTLTIEYWQRIWRYLSKRDGTIALPRFTIEYDITLNDALKTLGMTDAFSAVNADFSELWHKSPDTNVSIQKVRHKTFVKVNEEGTEAAAVTSVQVVLTDSVPPPPFEMIVDRPFVCAIVHEDTGLILFIGSILNPSG
jgi:serpin B